LRSTPWNDKKAGKRGFSLPGAFYVALIPFLAVIQHRPTQLDWPQGVVDEMHWIEYAWMALR
jgi:hypothetical protein